MHLLLAADRLHFQLQGWERLWAFHLSPSIVVELKHITQISTDLPKTTWRELRAPGTFLPGVIKAGTYYTDRGREFWHITKPDNCLTIDLKDGYFKRIVVNVDQSATWADRINQQRSRLSP